MEIVTRPHRDNLVRWAANRPEILVLSADLTSSCEADGFRDRYPERFFSLGMAEQNMMGFAAGLAREGFFPFVHTFAVFICRRPFDQVAMSIAYPNLPVRLIGFLPGITTPGGVTHQAIDDIGLMRLLPNMTVLECGDATDVESVLDVAQAVPGPVYVRMLRGEVPRLFDAAEPLVLGRSRALSEGSDLLVLSCGICTEEALRATRALRERGLSIAHRHVSTLKPFADPEVLQAIADARDGVIAMENHSTFGGLGSAVAELIAEHGLARRLIRIGLRDTYAHGASRQYLMHEYGLDAPALVRAAEDLTSERFDLTDEDLAAVRLETMARTDKTEDL
ncbi:transketolase, alpha subunit [Thioflavicoccus mobilis 8321]|uniref:Transketolase, alpha subunit n=1 Tax=Thioflavicoccus mobilis 8321 TaxID=765912 RepID=L0GUV6_9GAMM|nr:transketolase C-terminal domain-containing protein [Thioflavicoccus mobilis]AGA89607.1 transketolase, alpha subunit [Thioflavicoccus mobilis 8321]